MSVLDRDSAAQLRGMAASVDRANRPYWLVAIGGLVMTVAVVLLLISVVGQASARTRLGDDSARSTEIDRLLDQIADAEGNTIDLGELFPRTLLEVQIRDLVKAYEEELAATIDAGTSRAMRPSFTVGSRSDRVSNTNEELQLSDVSIRFTVPEIDQLTELIARFRADTYLRRGFVQRLQLSPANGTWRGDLLYRMYEVNR